MADDLDENYQLEKDLSSSENETEDDVEEEEEPKLGAAPVKFDKNSQPSSKQVENAKNSNKKKNKKKNITEILKLKGSEISKPKFAVEEFKKIIKKYLNENLSSVEKNDLKLSGDPDELNSKLDNLIMKRGKISKLKLDEQFNKKFNNKLENYLKKPKAKKLQRPFVLVLTSSAIRCIEIQKQLEKSNELIQKKRLRWMHAFAKHKKLNEQIEMLNKSKTPTHLVLGTPQRIAQLVEANALMLSCVKYVIIDYSHRDCKLKRFIDIPDIRQEFLGFTFKSLFQLNKEKNKFKFFLS